jgi:drug/metabolite transporter (DMT)-like permease
MLKERGMNEIVGVLAAVASSSLGGLSVGVTRLVVGATDPLTLGAFRFGAGCLLLLPLAWRSGGQWPAGRDLLPVAGLGLLYFGLFPVLFNASLVYTTAARGALALSTLPLLTMLAGAVLRVEPLTLPKAAGVSVAMLGVGVALTAGIANAPAGAWRGDLLMTAAALCMALYSIWSRPLVKRYGTAVYTAIAMTCGAAALIFLSWLSGGFHAAETFDLTQWSGVAFLGVFGGALTFLLWSYALEHTTPTRVAISVTVNPIAAGIFGAFVLREPITLTLVIGLLLVAGGIILAASNWRNARSQHQPARAR